MPEQVALAAHSHHYHGELNFLEKKPTPANVYRLFYFLKYAFNHIANFMNFFIGQIRTNWQRKTTRSNRFCYR